MSHPNPIPRILAIAGAWLAAGLAGAAPPFRLVSPDLPPNGTIAERHVADVFGCHGGNESPALRWSGAPANTRSFAVTMFDPYRPPASGWWHWIVYDLPATMSELPRGAGTPGRTGLPAGARQGLPDGETPERHYYGPCPDLGDPPHPYVITVYALSVDHLDVPATATAADIDYVISTRTIARAAITRPYRRPRGRS